MSFGRRAPLENSRFSIVTSSLRMVKPGAKLDPFGLYLISWNQIALLNFEIVFYFLSVLFPIAKLVSLSRSWVRKWVFLPPTISLSERSPSAQPNSFSKAPVSADSSPHFERNGDGNKMGTGNRALGAEGERRQGANYERFAANRTRARMHCSDGRHPRSNHRPYTRTRLWREPFYQ